MIRRTPRSTRTDTLFPYTTLFRSEKVAGRRIAVLGSMKELGETSDAFHVGLAEPIEAACVDHVILVGEEMAPLAKRSEERRVGKECVSTCRSRWSPYH